MLNKLRRLCLIALICIVHLVAFYFLNKNKIFLKYQQPKLMLVVNLTKDVNKESILFNSHKEKNSVSPSFKPQKIYTPKNFDLSEKISENYQNNIQEPNINVTPNSVPLDLDSLRRQALKNDKDRIRDPVEELHRKEALDKTVESEITNAIKRSEKKDCQTKYADNASFKHLAALAPLLYDTITDRCKWR